MGSVAGAALTPLERRVLERLVRLLEHEFGSELHGVWLYGSRARGERRDDESDIDVLVVASRRSADDDVRLIELRDEAADAEGASPAFFSLKLYEPELVAERRRIGSFFLQEVDRDKVVLAGLP